MEVSSYVKTNGKLPADRITRYSVHLSEFQVQHITAVLIHVVKCLC